MNLSKVIITFILIFAILFSFTGLCFADAHSSSTNDSFWDFVAGSIFSTGQLLSQSGNEYAGIVGLVLRCIGTGVGFVSGSDPGCLYSPDGLHHSCNWQNASTGEDSNGRYLSLCCDYCEQFFKCYDSELVTQLEQGYNEYIEDNNLNSLDVTPSGMLIYYFDEELARMDGSQLYPSNWELLSSISSKNHTRYFDVCPHTSSSSDGVIFNITVVIPYSGYGTLYGYKSVNDITASYRGNNRYYSANSSVSMSASAGGLIYSSDTILHYVYGPYYIVYSSIDNIFTPDIPQTIIVNDITYNVESYNFDKREFCVTNVAGDSFTITYGDSEYIITNNQNKLSETYNYNIDNTDPVAPSGDDNSENWSYLFRWLTSFKSWLGEQLSGLAIGDTIINNEDVEINYINSDGESENKSLKSTFRGLRRKFNFVTQIYNIAVQLGNDITNDSVSAQQISNGLIPTSWVSRFHASGPVSEAFDSSDSYDQQVEADDPNVDYTVQLGTATAPAVSFYFPEYDFYGFQFGGYYVLDFSWYAPYKPDVDRLVSGFMWAGFLWLLFKRLPGIINGSAMMEDGLSKLEDDNKKH